MLSGMKIVLGTLIVCAFVVADAQDAPTVDPLVAVSMQAMVSRKFLDAYERISMAQLWSTAGSNWFQMLMEANKHSDQHFGAAVVAPGQQQYENLEEDEGYDEEGEFSADEDYVSMLELETERRDLEEGSVYLSQNRPGNPGMMALQAAYAAFTAIKRWTHVTIFQAADMQQEFWMERTIQLSSQSQGLSSQISQLLYLRSFRLHLNTLKLSYQLQTISHFTMWLEDEIDVSKTFVDPNNKYRSIVAIDQGDDLIQDKLYAFQAFNTYAMLEMQQFYIDMYSNYMLMSLTGVTQEPPAAQPAANVAAATSMLEVESEAAPFFSPVANPVMFQQWTYILRFYRIMVQVYAAQQALTSVMSEQLAYKKATDNDPTNDEEGKKYLSFARQSFAGFAQQIQMRAQLDMYLGLFDLFSLYSPMPTQASSSAAATANA